MTEEWRDLPDYEGHYEVSNLGRIRSVKAEPKILKLSSAGAGNLLFTAWKNGKGKSMTAGRAVAQAWLGAPLDGGWQVHRANTETADDRVANLSWSYYGQ